MDINSKLTIDTGISVSPAWSPDGKKIAFGSNRSGNPQNNIKNIRTKSVRRITFKGNDNTPMTKLAPKKILSFAKSSLYGD